MGSEMCIRDSYNSVRKDVIILRIQLDILRDILRLVIENESGDLCSYDFNSPDFSSETIAFHIKILINEGCLTAIDGSTKDGIAYYGIEQTFKGQQFYDAIADDKVWEKIRKYIAKHGVEITVQSIIAVAGRFITS